jgi:hypothetical protein
VRSVAKTNIPTAAAVIKNGIMIRAIDASLSKLIFEHGAASLIWLAASLKADGEQNHTERFG